MAGLSEALYRKATIEDVHGILSLIRSSVDGLLKDHGFFDTSPFTSTRMPAIPQRSPWLEMALQEDPEGFWVAEVGGELAGVGLSWVRGSLWYLAHLFVLPNHQGAGIGQGLMARTLKNHEERVFTNRALVTFAYNPVSISLYARHGILPREPLYFMECPKEKVKLDRKETTLKVQRAEEYQSVSKNLSWIDEECLGFPRERNHQFLFSLPNVRCHLFSLDHELLGYSYVWQIGRIGPLAAVSKDFFPDILKVSLALARDQEGPNVGMLATGSNEELMKTAFEQGMRIVDNFLFMSSKPFPNFSTYILYPTGAML